MEPWACRGSGPVLTYGTGLMAVRITDAPDGTTQGSPFRNVPDEATPSRVQENTPNVTVVGTPERSGSTST